MRAAAIFAAFVVLAAALAALITLAPRQDADEAPPFAVEAELTIPDEGEWRIEYRFSEPVMRAAFPRSGGDYRRGSWTVETEGVVLERAGETDVIRRADGAPMQGFAARLVPHTGHLPQEYTPALIMQGGSMALFIDQFHVGDAGPAGEDDPLTRAVRFDSSAVRWPAEAWLAVQTPDFAHLSGDGLRTEDSGGRFAMGDSGYLYTGHIAPVTTPDVTAVLDPAAPEWLREYLTDSLVRLFAFLGERLDTRPQRRPAVYALYGELEGRNVSLNGGVVAGQLAFNIRIGDGLGDSPALRRHLIHLFAHEAAHLWQFRRPRDMTAAWFHEGGADALAFLALREMGETDGEQAARSFGQSAAACAGQLEAGPLSGALARGQFRAYYDCGAVIHLALHAAAARNGHDGLYAVWLAVFGQAGDDSLYGEDEIFTAAAELAGDGMAAALRAFVHDDHADGRAAVAALMDGAGLAIAFDDGGAASINGIAL
ncbi:MAG: hypothetical protein KIS81_07460 [Maricaulaceae bacterium]|nr:hypothetical protein [Maricaulaceae bacterium]